MRITLPPRPRTLSPLAEKIVLTLTLVFLLALFAYGELIVGPMIGVMP